MDLPKNSDRMQRIEIYKNKIDLEMQLYIESLPDQSLIYKVGPFRGMLKHISVNVFKADRITDRKTDRNINFSDPVELDRLWDIFVAICYLYNQNISISNFGMFTGINYNTFMQWSNVNSLDNSSILQDDSLYYGIDKSNLETYKEMIKRWSLECQDNLIDHTMKENSIGSMFLLKSIYGMTESPQRIEIAASTDKVDRAALMDKYKDQEQPEKPKLTDNIDK